MHPFGKPGEYWKPDTARQKMHAMSFSKESGSAPNSVVAKVVASIAPVYGKLGVCWRRVKVIMPQLDAVSVVPWMRTVEMLLQSPHGH
jgi:hypothetical protein